MLQLFVEFPVLVTEHLGLWHCTVNWQLSLQAIL